MPIGALLRKNSRKARNGLVPEHSTVMNRNQIMKKLKQPCSLMSIRMDLVTPLRFSWILMPVKPPTTDKANSFDSTDHQHGKLTIEKERERERERERGDLFINGSPDGFFNSFRGSRQKIFLSPLLFVVSWTL
jgi:hypothetical protein